MLVKPEYNEKDGCFICHNDENKHIVEYDPIRIKISKKGTIQMLFTKFILNDKHKKFVLI